MKHARVTVKLEERKGSSQACFSSQNSVAARQRDAPLATVIDRDTHVGAFLKDQTTLVSGRSPSAPARP